MFNIENMIDAMIHIHYVSQEGIIETAKITRNWSDPKEAIKMMVAAYCRYYGITEKSFISLLSLVDVLTAKDLFKNRGGIAAALVFYGLEGIPKDEKTQEEISRALGVSMSTIRTHRPLIEELKVRAQQAILQSR